MNKLFLYCQHHGDCDLVVVLKIGSREHGRRVWLTAEEAQTLSNKLQSFAKGGESSGVVEFELRNA